MATNRTVEHLVVEYEVVRGGDESFVAKMNKAIEEGWQPIGGVTIHPHLHYFAQAVVKYLEREK